jgi:hypothetical protein
MPHTFKIGQLVGLAQTSRGLETYEVVQLICPRRRPANRNAGSRDCRAAPRAVREAEIKPHS